MTGSMYLRRMRAAQRRRAISYVLGLLAILAVAILAILDLVR